MDIYAIELHQHLLAENLNKDFYIKSTLQTIRTSIMTFVEAVKPQLRRKLILSFEQKLIEKHFKDLFDHQVSD